MRQSWMVDEDKPRSTDLKVTQTVQQVAVVCQLVVWEENNKVKKENKMLLLCLDAVAGVSFSLFLIVVNTCLHVDQYIVHTRTD